MCDQERTIKNEKRTTILIIRERKSFVIHQTQVLRIQRKGGLRFRNQAWPFWTSGRAARCGPEMNDYGFFFLSPLFSLCLSCFHCVCDDDDDVFSKRVLMRYRPYPSTHDSLSLIIYPTLNRCEEVKADYSFFFNRCMKSSWKCRRVTPCDVRYHHLWYLSLFK